MDEKFIVMMEVAKNRGQVRMVTLPNTHGLQNLLMSLLFLVHVLGGLTLALNGTCLHSLLQKSIRGMD